MTDSPSQERWDFLILAGAAFFSPMIVWANSSEGARPWGFLALGGLVLILALGVRWVMTRVGLDSRGSTYSIAVLVFSLSNAGLLLDRGYPRLLLFVGSVVVAALVYALRDSSMLGVVLLWGGIFVLGYPWLVWFTSGTDPGTRQTLDPDPLNAEFIDEDRDIVLIVLDGYANSDVLEEMYGHDMSGFGNQLAERGFDVSHETTANYGRTRLSVSSVMQLGYPVEPGPFPRADFDHLLDVIGGENVLTRWLTDNGYFHTYVESGWFGTRCTDEVDSCVRGPWPDESLYDVTNRSILKDLPPFETGRSFHRGARQVLSWLANDLEGYLDNGRPDLIYSHVLAPHPPLFLDSTCESRPGEGFKGFTIAQPDMTAMDLRHARDWYAMQVECVNRFLVGVADLAAESNSIVVMFGDHGPDSLGQLFMAGSEWSEEQRWERMSAMVAARVPGCDMSQIDSLVNLGRRMVSCISDADLPDLPTSTFEIEPTSDGERIVEVPAPTYGADS